MLLFLTEIIKIDDNLVIIGLAGKMPDFVKKMHKTSFASFDQKAVCWQVKLRAVSKIGSQNHGNLVLKLITLLLVTFTRQNDDQRLVKMTTKG